MTQMDVKQEFEKFGEKGKKALLKEINQ